MARPSRCVISLVSFLPVMRANQVVLPERNLRTALRLQTSQKLSEVVALLCSKFSLAPAEDYALFQSGNGGVTRLEAVRSVGSCAFPNMVAIRFSCHLPVLTCARWSSSCAAFSSASQ